MKKRKSAYSSAHALHHQIIRDGDRRVIFPLVEARPRRCFFKKVAVEATGELVQHLIFRKIETVVHAARLLSQSADLSSSAAIDILPDVASNAADAASTAGEGLLDGLSDLFDWISF